MHFQFSAVGWLPPSSSDCPEPHSAGPWTPPETGHPSSSLTSLRHCLTAFWEKNFFLISHLNPSSFTLKLLSSAQSLQPLIKHLSSVFVDPRQLLEKPHWGLPWVFSRLNKPSYFSLSSKNKHTQILLCQKLDIFSKIPSKQLLVEITFVILPQLFKEIFKTYLW